MEIYIVGLIISGILFTGFIILSVIKKNKPALGCLSFSLFILFYCLSNLYEDNYSIESLITTLGLSRGDILTYEFNVKQGLKHCKIKGNYTNNQLEFDLHHLHQGEYLQLLT